MSTQTIERTTLTHLIHNENYCRKVIPFINDMASAYSLSDLVICRSGALTISELTAAASQAS